MIFPVEDVRAAREDGRLQREYAASVEAAAKANPNVRCAECGAVTWFYFSSPPETWEHLCGRGETIAWCDDHGQVEFVEEMIS